MYCIYKDIYRERERDKDKDRMIGRHCTYEYKRIFEKKEKERKKITI